MAAAIENAFPELERELDFIPLGVPNPKVLTQAQIDHYNEFGYVAPIDVFSEEEVAVFRHYFDDLLPRAMDAGWGQYVSPS
jgi:non-heme Fe2+,alpha-ketoglutarate-dependent halogenase